MVEVLLLSALICFGGECYPTLVGPRTKVGEYTLTQYRTKRPGYGGDILGYRETETEMFAIHRVWLLKPSQRRLERLRSEDPKQRRSITDGCINVENHIYDKLVASYRGATLRIINK